MRGMKRPLPLLALLSFAALGAAWQFIAFKLVVLW